MEVKAHVRNLRMSARKVRLKTVEIDELTVRRLHVLEPAPESKPSPKPKPKSKAPRA